MADFDGATAGDCMSSSVTGTELFDVDATDWWMMAWVRSSLTKSNGVIYGSRAGLTDQNWSAVRTDGSWKLRHSFADAFLTPALTVGADEWHHYAIHSTPTGIFAYIDGASICTLGNCVSTPNNMVDGRVWFMCFQDSTLFSEGAAYEFILDSDSTHPPLTVTELRTIILFGATGQADCAVRKAVYGQFFGQGC
jgi:hypothetical protein